MLSLAQTLQCKGCLNHGPVWNKPPLSFILDCCGTEDCASCSSGVTNWFRSIVGRHQDRGWTDPGSVSKPEWLPQLQFQLLHASDGTSTLQLPDARSGTPSTLFFCCSSRWSDKIEPWFLCGPLQKRTQLMADTDQFITSPSRWLDWVVVRHSLFCIRPEENQHRWKKIPFSSLRPVFFSFALGHVLS